jgi:hypothetical protein
MRTLVVDISGATAVVGLSPWILPLVAIAAKRREELARGACLSRVLVAWWRGRDRAARDDREHQQVVINERLRARIEATIWPD